MRRFTIEDWNYVLNTSKDGLYSLIVTLAFLAMLTLLIMADKITSDNPLILPGLSIILTFWFSGAAHRWASSVSQQQQPSQPPGQLTDAQITTAMLAKQQNTPPPSNNGHATT